ncbi:hypothetical protein IJT17_09915 [bacterium]|nr:hypothetical protein [bacterium]
MSKASAPSTKRKYRRYAKLCLRTALIVLLFFFLSDIIVYWIYGPNWARNYIADEQNIWNNRPGYWASYENGEVTERVGIDHMRISHPLAVSEKNKYKCLVLGCSYTFGVGVADNETYVWKLNELSPDTEFINGGMPGYGAKRLHNRLPDFLAAHHYDLVIYAVLHDHPARDAAPAFRRMDPDAFLMPYTELTPDFEFKDHTAYRLVWWGDRYYAPINMLKKSYIAMVGTREYPKVRLANIPIIFAHQVNQLALLCAQNGTRFVLMILDKEPYNSDLTKAIPLFSHMVSGVYDVSFPYELSAQYRVLGNIDNHPNAEVHSYWAKAIAAEIKKHKDLYQHRMHQ